MCQSITMINNFSLQITKDFSFFVIYNSINNRLSAH